MSNALHHVAPASFFPTAKEVSSGLQWFKEHPILAAAAATAVSVITYLNTADDSTNDLESSDGAAVDALAKESGELLNEFTANVSMTHAHMSAVKTTAATKHNRRASSPSSAAGKALSPSRRASLPSTSTGRATPPALRKPGSEGKLQSPAAVSWVDEHGGSLTQVFEHLSVADPDDDDHENQENRDANTEGHDQYPDLDRPLRPASRFHGRPPTPPTHRRSLRPSDDHSTSSSSSEETGASTQSNGLHWMGTLAHGGVQSPQLPNPERQTESPQWGWYVPITPPQDHLQHGAASNLPRAAVMPPPSSSARSSHAPSAHVAPINGSESGTGAESSMRRSTSGRIKA